MSKDRALGRLLDYYQHTAALAAAHLARQTRPVPSSQGVRAALASAPDLADYSEAIEWAQAERANLFACLDHVTATGQSARIVGLTAGLVDVLQQDGHWTDTIVRHNTAARAA